MIDKSSKSAYIKGMNMRLLAFISLIAFTALAVFGFAAMLGEMNETHGNCLASIANNGCPMPLTGPAMAAFHVSAYQAFSTAILALAIMVLLVLSAFLLETKRFESLRSRERSWHRLSWQFVCYESVIKKYRDWLSQLEKRDPACSF